MTKSLTCNACGEPFVRLGEDGKLRWNICYNCPHKIVSVSDREDQATVIDKVEDSEAGQ